MVIEKLQKPAWRVHENRLDGKSVEITQQSIGGLIASKACDPHRQKLFSRRLTERTEDWIASQPICSYEAASVNVIARTLTVDCCEFWQTTQPLA